MMVMLKSEQFTVWTECASSMKMLIIGKVQCEGPVCALYRIPLAPSPPAMTPQEHHGPAAAGPWAAPDPAPLWPWRCSALCRCPCTYLLNISCPENTLFGGLDEGHSSWLSAGNSPCPRNRTNKKKETRTLWADWSSSFKELISCFRYWTSDSFTLSITWRTRTWKMRLKTRSNRLLLPGINIL